MEREAIGIRHLQVLTECQFSLSDEIFDKIYAEIQILTERAGLALSLMAKLKQAWESQDPMRVEMARAMLKTCDLYWSEYA